MELKSVLINWIKRFVLIHGAFMIGLYVLYSVIMPERTFDVPFLGKTILFSFLATLPGFVYLSKHELSDREWWVRTIIQYVLLNVLLLPLAYSFGLCQNFTGIVGMMLLILVIDVLVHVIIFGMNIMAAKRLNTELMRRVHRE